MLKLECGPDPYLLEVGFMERPENARVKEPVADAIPQLRVGDDLRGIKLAQVYPFLIGKIRYKGNVLQDKKGCFKHRVCLYIGIRRVVKVPAQDIEVAPEPVVPVLGEV